MNYDDLVHKIRGLAEAYPEDVFPDFTKELTQEERKQNSVLITLVSASMGRHLGQFFLEAADAIQALQRDAMRYEFVRRLNVTQFKAIFDENIKTSRRFDDLIDEAMQHES